MSDYIIMTDSTCDLPQEVADKYDLRVVCLSVILDGKEYMNYLDGRELSFKDMYAAMRAGKLPTTSAVNISQFMEAMEPELQAGKDILYIGFSSTMSGTYSAGCTAARELLEKYTDRKILTVDTRAATTGEGLLVELCARMKEEGKPIEEVHQFAEDNKMKMRHLLTVEDLFHLQRGGRMNKTTAIFGSLLGVKPILIVNRDGRVEATVKARGTKKAYKIMIDDVINNIIDKDLPIYVSHCDNDEGSAEVARLLKEEVGCTDVRINYLGAVCGCHGGPDLVGIFYYGNEREQ